MRDYSLLLKEANNNNPYACLILAKEILHGNIKNSDHDVLFWLNHAVNLPPKYDLLKQTIKHEYIQKRKVNTH